MLILYTGSKIYKCIINIFIYIFPLLFIVSLVLYIMYIYNFELIMLIYKKLEIEPSAGVVLDSNNDYILHRYLLQKSITKENIIGSTYININNFDYLISNNFYNSYLNLRYFDGVFTTASNNLVT